jgi:hypothetical protein
VAYTDISELFRVLKVRSPTQAQTDAGQRVLDAAADEINSECGTAFGTPAPALVVEVNLERAAELWARQEIPTGVIGLGEALPILTPRDTWDWYANKLAPYKISWGLS